MKEIIKSYIKRLVVEGLEKVSGNKELFGDNYWYAGVNLWEPPVVFVLKDIVHPGMVVFDIGGNMGGISSAVSRLVGPKGIVCTFEASPRIIAHLQRNMVHQGNNNVTVYHLAVYSKSNEYVTIYEGGHLNDSIVVENSPTKIGHKIKTVSMDDFCNWTSLEPEVVKMDIEGAEYDALLGFKRTLSEKKPHLIVEQQRNDTRCFSLLQSLGYRTIDCNNYSEIKTEDAFSNAKAMLMNLLYVHEDKWDDLQYAKVQKVLVTDLSPEDFSVNHLKGLTSRKMELQAGRYLFDLDFIANGTDNNIFCGVRLDGEVVFRYHAYTALLADSYTEWMVDIPLSGNVELFFDFNDGTEDNTLRFSRGKVYKYEGVESSLWSQIAMQ